MRPVWLSSSFVFFDRTSPSSGDTDGYTMFSLELMLELSGASASGWPTFSLVDAPKRK